jgi:putative Mg2+ transporter-C (MgtC) family protein
MTDPLLLLDLFIRLICAVVLGAGIGLERQWRLRTAGIRTNALVAAGSALFVMLGAVALPGNLADPTRVAAQVVSGIGFLGAGVILRDGFNIRGLTTAATLWCAAAIGSLCGAGMEELAAIGAVTIVGTNTLLRPLSRAINRRMGHDPVAAVSDDGGSGADYVFEVITLEKSQQRVRALAMQALYHPHLTLKSLDVKDAKGSHVRVLAGLTIDGPDDVSVLEQAVQRISLDPKVIGSRWWQEEGED